MRRVRRCFRTGFRQPRLSKKDQIRGLTSSEAEVVVVDFCHFELLLFENALDLRKVRLWHPIMQRSGTSVYPRDFGAIRKFGEISKKSLQIFSHGDVGPSFIVQIE